MVNSLRGLWRFANTPVDELFRAESVQGGVEAAKAVFELADTLQKQQPNSETIDLLVGNISTLLDVLNSPLGQVVKSTLPFVSIGSVLLTSVINKTGKKPTIAQNAALVIQVAYLLSFKETLAANEELKNQLEQNNTEASDELQKQITKLGDLELTDKEALEALVFFPQSKLAKAFNPILIERLKEAGIAQNTAEDLVNKVQINTNHYINQSLAEIISSDEKVKRLFNWYQTGGKEVFEKYFSIDTYLEERIDPLPKEKVFQETFTFEDIYVPLKAIPLDNNNNEKPGAQSFILEEKAEEFLTDITTQNKVLFIQGGPGRGKSVFCRMFANWVRQKLHPQLTPILIRLRDIDSFQLDFNSTIKSALSSVDFVNNDTGWLSDVNTRYLFLLDGFDELYIEGRVSGGLERFINQVCMFQKHTEGKEGGHRVILTGRPLALQGINYLPDNLERVKLLEMDDELQNSWLNKWQKVVNPDPSVASTKTEAFRQFLLAENCPREVKNELAREPLLLYLLAKMHRDEQIKVDDFQQAKGIEGKILIYEKFFEFLLKEQRPELLNLRLTEVQEIE